MPALIKASQWLSKNLVLAIPVAIVLGLAFGLTLPTAWLQTLIVPFTFLMVYPMMVTLRLKKVLEGGDTKAQLVTQGLNFFVLPFLAYGMGLLFFKDRPDLAFGLLLASLVPTSGMTISYTGLAKGNMEAALKMTVVGLIVGSLATPFYVRWLMGASIEVDQAAVLRQIVLIVFAPMAIGYATQVLLIKKHGEKAFWKEVGPKFPGFSTVGVIAMVFVAIAMKAKNIAAQPQLILVIGVPLLILYGLNFLISTLIGRALFDRENAIALVYGTVMRNLSIALAIAMTAFGAQGASAALVVALAYIVQVQSAAWYLKIADRIFGPPTPPAAA